MRKSFLLGLLLIAPVIGSCQSFTLPTLYLDSLLFESSKYRVCDSVQMAQANEIQKLNTELIHSGTALRLSQKSNSLCDSLLLNAKAGREILGMQFAKDLKEERRKTKRWRNSTFISVAVIVVLILTSK